MKVISVFLTAFLSACHSSSADLQLWQELCQHSEYGESQCRSNLQQFLRSNPDGPLSDFEMQMVFGDVPSDDTGHHLFASEDATSTSL